MYPLELPSPAKLNLFLHILGRRPDGYHRLQTLFLILDYGDTLHFTRTQKPGITLRPELEGVKVHDNLVYRAAALLLEECGLDAPPFGVAIDITKRLPMGGGLGGGSSNAATTLHALNRLWSLNLTTGHLARLGLKLGADVPVFIHGHTAWGDGVGEQLTPIPLALPGEPSSPTYYLVVKPDCSVPTAQVFSDERLTRDTPESKIAPAVKGIGHNFRNDCEATVRRLFPPVNEAFEWLDRFGKARLTGTGACLFLELSRREQAEAILDQLPQKWTGFVAQGVMESPLLTALKRYEAGRA